MNSDDMASDSSKDFLVVKCQKPANGTLKYVCVQKYWIVRPITDKMVGFVYPNEDITRTFERLMKNEPPGHGWRSYFGDIIHETESARDAIHFYHGIPPITYETIKQHDGEGSKNTSVTEARGSLEVKIEGEDYGWKSEKRENMKKSTKKILNGNNFKAMFQFKGKSNKFKVKNMKKRAPKENFRSLSVNTENTFLGPINTPKTTEVNQNKPGFKHIMTKCMKLNIKDIRYSSEPELKRVTLTLNKTNSVVSKASLSENVQKDVHMTFRNFSPSDKKLLVKLQNEEKETFEKIGNLQLQLKDLFMKENKNKEALTQLLLKYQDRPLEAMTSERRNDQDSNMNDDEMKAEEDDKEDDEKVPLISEEEEEKASEKEEMEGVSDVDSKQFYVPPSSPELLKKDVRNNKSSRWTLKYEQSGKGLIQLGNSHVYLCASGLQRCKRTCRNVTTFVRELYKEVFTREALSTCSMTGKKPIFGRSKCPPALDCEAQSVIINYALNYSRKNGWDHVNRDTLLRTIRNMLVRFRNKRYKLLASNIREICFD